MFDYNDIAFCGMKADSGYDRVESFAASGEVGFGVIVTADGPGVKVQAGGTGKVRGGSVHSHTVSLDGYQDKDAVSVMTRGLLWCRVKEGETVTEDGPVAYDPATGHVLDYDTDNAVPNAVFRSSNESSKCGDIALVEFHHPFA